VVNRPIADESAVTATRIVMEKPALGSRVDTFVLFSATVEGVPILSPCSAALYGVDAWIKSVHSKALRATLDGIGGHFDEPTC
jgi:hypothetical protein